MTKKRVITVAAMVGSFAICWLVICIAAAQNKTEPKDAAKQLEDAYRQIYDATKQQRDAYQKHLDEDADRGKRVDALLAKYEAMTTREEETSKRYAKVLDTWEKQQQQYQKYLDSLPKK